MARSDVAIVHDYLTQRGGAEKVVAAMTRAFPGAGIHTSLYDPDRTFRDFTALDIRASWLQHFPALRRDHRRALPLLAPTFSAMNVDARVVICSSSGWAHGARVTGKKVVYCYTPARWLYQPDLYLSESASAGARAALAVLRGPLIAWDKSAAATADRYLAISTVVRDRIRDAYRIDAEILHPPCTIDPEGELRPIEGIESGFWLCVARLLPYKNVRQIVEAFASLKGHRLLIIGSGPELKAVEEAASANTVIVERASEAVLRWAYSESRGLVAASYEDFGLTPLEAAAFGKPSVVLRWGGFLDTIIEGETGNFFDAPEPAQISEALRDCDASQWDEDRIRSRAEDFSEAEFATKLRRIVDELAVS